MEQTWPSSNSWVQSSRRRKRRKRQRSPKPPRERKKKRRRARNNFVKLKFKQEARSLLSILPFCVASVAPAVSDAASTARHRRQDAGATTSRARSSSNVF